MPLKTKGTEITTYSRATEYTPAMLGRGAKGMANWVRKLATTVSAIQSAERAMAGRTASGPKRSGRRWTMTAPTVMPNMATEMATKAK